VPGGDLTVFDNGGSLLGSRPGCPLHPAQALRLRLRPAERRARVVLRIASKQVAEGRTPYYPGSVGSTRVGPDGGSLIAWGSAGRITEHDRRGRVRFRMALDSWTYRAVRARWRAQPAQPPALVVRRRGGDVRLWASWNGSTTVRAWQALAGPSAQRLRRIGPAVPFADLETRLRVRTGARCVAVQALSGKGRVLARSRVAPARC
jgi:hypothetical protein